MKSIKCLNTEIVWLKKKYNNLIVTKVIAIAITLVVVVTGLNECSGNTSQEMSSSESVEQTTDSSPATPVPTIEIDDLSQYNGLLQHQNGKWHTIEPKCYKFMEPYNIDQFKKVIEIVNTLVSSSDIGNRNFKTGSKVELGRNAYGIAIMANRDKIINDSRAKLWDEKYPKTEMYIGPGGGGYIEKKYVDEVIEKYFCADRQNISFEGIKHSFCEQEGVYSILATGREVGTLPILWDFVEKDNSIECVFSFVNIQYEVSRSAIYAYDSKLKDNIIIGDYKTTTANTPDGEVKLAQPHIPEENRDKLNKVKFIFKNDNDSLKVYSVEYL